MREIRVDELAGAVDDPFLRHQVDPSRSERAWVGGRAAVVDVTAGRPDARGPVFSSVGPAEDLVPLMAAVAATGARPVRLSVEQTAAGSVPAPWRHVERRRWDWMLTRTSPADGATGAGRSITEVVELDEDDAADRAAVDAVIDAAMPDSHARPGVPGLETWLGVRVAGELAGIGALVRMYDGTGHLRGVSVLPDHRGRGIGSVLSEALTRRALAGGGVATLGAYSDNEAALRVYRRLGYRTVHTFVSGPTVAGPVDGE